MERQEILKRISEILYRIGFVSNISEDTKIQDLKYNNKLNAYDSVSIEIVLERRFNLPLDSCDCFVSNSETIKDVFDKLPSLINK